jgi:hypothetical protein
MVGEDDWFELPLDLVAVFSGEDINSDLIVAQLTDIGLKKEDIGALHARVKNLASGHFVALFPAHDGATARDSIQSVAARDVHNQRPVLRGTTIDLLRAPQKLHVSKVHAGRLPDLDHVASHGLNLLQVAAHLVVELREPIRNPELEAASGFREFVNIDHFHDALGDVHPP